MATIKVTCGVIFDGDKVFVCRRKAGKSLAGFWEFPGGKVEPGESLEDCLRRELHEELDMDVKDIAYFMTNKHNYNTFSIELIAFSCQYVSSSFRLIDHDKYQWVSVTDLTDWKLAAADTPIAEALKFHDY